MGLPAAAWADCQPLVDKRTAPEADLFLGRCIRSLFLGRSKGNAMLYATTQYVVHGFVFVQRDAMLGGACNQPVRV